MVHYSRVILLAGFMFVMGLTMPDAFPEWGLEFKHWLGIGCSIILVGVFLEPREPEV